MSLAALLVSIGGVEAVHSALHHRLHIQPPEFSTPDGSPFWASPLADHGECPICTYLHGGRTIVVPETAVFFTFEPKPDASRQAGGLPCFLCGSPPSSRDPPLVLSPDRLV